ncbi:MAG: 4'-phosphopantetheinyl transferase superfamily protein [bacterium]|nr:4'-phosphopantetheinyl transferase superfamily protein [bacterium]
MGKEQKKSVPFKLVRIAQEKRLTLMNTSGYALKRIKKIKSHTFEQSFYGRLLVARIARIPKKDIESFLIESLTSFYSKKYHFYWTLSHKKDWICAAMSTKPIGIDIEYLEKKNKRLFKTFTDQEWDILGRKTWHTFYSGWTAKEAALKMLSLPFRCIRDIRITEKQRNSMTLFYKKRTASVHIYTRKNIIIAIAQQSIGT